MPSPSLDLDLDPVSADEVRRDWLRLQAAGLPSRADHRGSTNRPHVTVLATSALGAELGSAAVELADLLPRPFEWAGLVVLGGGSRVVLARLVGVDAELAAVVERLRERVPEPAARSCVPHVTLCTRLPVERLGEAVALLAPQRGGGQGSFVALRRWEPSTGLVHDVAPRGADGVRDGAAGT